MKTRLILPALAVTGALGIAAVGCSSTPTTTSTGASTTAAGGASTTTAAKAPDTMKSTDTTMKAPGTTMGTAKPAAATMTAADLRSTLTTLLNSHVVLASAATGNALAGRSAEFDAAVAELDKNSDDITAAIGSIYGDEAGAAFGPLWKKHIGFFVDYTKAVAAGDKATADATVEKLTQYASDFAAFLSSANPNLPKDAVADLVKTHILTLKDVVDAQAAKDPVKTYENLAKAIGHMHAIADPLSGAIAKQFPDKFSGDPMGKTADLQVGLNSLLQQHVALAAAATGNAVGGRQAEFEAAAKVLDQNSDDITAAIASVYGDEAGAAFGPLWKKHIGFFVDYTKAAASGDQAGADEVAAKLTQYASDFAAFLASANPNLPKDAVADLVKTHILTLKDVVDQQVKKDPVATYAALAKAMKHMHMIADPLSAAIAKQFPEKFPS